jgi:hypothetical protein
LLYDAFRESESKYESESERGRREGREGKGEQNRAREGKGMESKGAT